MLILFDLPKNMIHAFNTYSTLYNHIESLERARVKGKWVFARHSWQRMMSCYRYVRDQALLVQPTTSGIFEQGLEEAMKQAAGETTGKEDGKNLDVLEIINGNVKKPLFIPVTPDVDAKALMQKWCQTYCKSHGLPLFEVSSPADFKEAGGGHD